MRVQRLESIAAIATIVAFEAMLLLLSVTVCHVPASQEEAPEEAGTPVSSIEFEQPVLDIEYDPADMKRTYDAVVESGEMAEWYEKPYDMPLYLQEDEAWASLPYANGTVGGSGCGLAAAAMAMSYLAKAECTLPYLYSEVGSSCTVNGLNNMSGFAEYASRAYGIESSDIFFSVDDAIARSMQDGSVVACSMTGALGDRSYGGHIVLLWSPDNNVIRIADPASADNSSRQYSIDEVKSIRWSYFYEWKKERL